MSRSRRSTPIVGTTAGASEKRDKAVANRKSRHALKQTLAGAKLDDATDDAPKKQRHRRSGQWEFTKDGKQWVGPRDPKLMRK